MVTDDGTSCLVALRSILQLAGSDDGTAIEAFHELIDARGCGEVRTALTALQAGRTRAGAGRNHQYRARFPHGRDASMRGFLNR